MRVKMQINKVGPNKYQIKTKEAVVLADESGVEVEGLKFSGPGEYERKGIFVEGILPDGEGCIFVIHLEEMSLCFLGKISKLLTDEAVKALGDIDLLFVPFGDEQTLKPGDAEKTISTIDPRIIIPIYIASDTNIETILGMKAEEPESLKIKKIDLPQEDRRLILIS